MSVTENSETPDPSRCPLCGGANDCQLCTASAYKGPCWCERVKIPDDLLVQIPHEARNKACICRECVFAFHRQSGAAAPKPLPGDFYFDAHGLMVFTEAYHLRRGYCCDSGCRHCPYKEMPDNAAPMLA